MTPPTDRAALRRLCEAAIRAQKRENDDDEQAIYAYEDVVQNPAIVLAPLEEIERLEGALEKYGRHRVPDEEQQMCPKAYNLRHGCRCGLDAARRGRGEEAGR